MYLVTGFHVASKAEFSCYNDIPWYMILLLPVWIVTVFTDYKI